MIPRREIWLYNIKKKQFKFVWVNPFLRSFWSLDVLIVFSLVLYHYYFRSYITNTSRREKIHVWICILTTWVRHIVLKFPISDPLSLFSLFPLFTSGSLSYEACSVSLAKRRQGWQASQGRGHPHNLQTFMHSAVARQQCQVGLEEGYPGRYWADGNHRLARI